MPDKIIMDKIYKVFKDYRITQDYTHEKDLLFLLDLVIKNVPDNSIIVEIGTAFAKTAIALAMVAKPKTIVISIDSYKWKNTITWQTYHTNYRRVMKVGLENLILVHQSSEDFAKSFNHKIDFLWIDGDHQYDSVYKDIKLWFPKIKQNCIICGHDYRHVDNGVIKAVDELVKGKSGYKNFGVFNNSIWYVTKE